MQKQKEAEQPISEANNRLLKAAANQNTTDLLAAQALLQSGTTMLTEARKEQDNLPVLHQPSKKTETEVTFMRCIQRLSHVYVIVPACFAEHCVTVTVTVTEALVLRPLLEDRGRITESIRILVPVNSG